MFKIENTINPVSSISKLTRYSAVVLPTKSPYPTVVMMVKTQYTTKE